jgi:ribosomal small subunit protein bTHX
MGRGDIRSKKGKIKNGSYGKTRKARTSATNAVASAPAVEKKASAKKTTKKAKSDN